MAAFTFTLRQEPTDRVDLSALQPARLATLSIAEIERLVIGGGRTPVQVGDVFAVTPGHGETVVFAGGHERFDRIGAGLGGGLIRVEGDAGARLGAGMLGGVIDVAGQAGPFAGTGMAGGFLRIAGDAGEAAGGALDGRLAGMSGGTLAIGGRAGARLGERMRRGLIVARAAGPHAGAHMIAGTVVAGELGAQPGFLMRRGSLIAGHLEGHPLPTFGDCGLLDLPFLSLLARALGRMDLPWRPELHPVVRRFQGDLASLGQGELLLAVT